jgi:hypothetical protein
MSLETIDFTERKKRYKLEMGEFTLKPPYMYLVSQAEGLIKKMMDIGQSVKIKESDSNADIQEALNKIAENKDIKKIIEVQLKLLKLLLEETETGKLSDITADNLRQDVVQVVIEDFFAQYRK